MTVLEAIVIEDVGEVLKLGLSIMQKIMVWNLDLTILTLVRIKNVNGRRKRHNSKCLTIT
jgi:hypothetical protein